MRGKRFCRYCKHWTGILHPVSTAFICSAYPEGIPDVFVNGEFEHIVPYKQSNDIVWSPSDAEETEAAVDPDEGIRADG